MTKAQKAQYTGTTEARDTRPAYNTNRFSYLVAITNRVLKREHQSIR